MQSPETIELKRDAGIDTAIARQPASSDQGTQPSRDVRV